MLTLPYSRVFIVCSRQGSRAINLMAVTEAHNINQKNKRIEQAQLGIINFLSTIHITSRHKHK